ncbi:Ldh family oxidoreductase [Candidatus Parcubacteria bacterium]|nr:Ldh family oxidoreductase [Candidatus Parcubacteria bacterium]
MRLQIKEIRKTLVDIILSKGSISKTDAEALANDYLEGELQGKQSHGLAAFIAIAPKLSEKRPDMEIIKESESALYIEAHEAFGAIVGRKAANILIEKAKQQGVAIAYIRNMKSWLRPAIIAQYVAEHDMVGFVINTGGPPMVAPPGGKDPVVGTNPVGIGIPSAKNPVLADMATSKRAWGEVRLAKRFGHDLPKNSYYDKNGNFAVSPDDAYSALPMGDYKGFALGLFIEIMGGSFVDMNMGKGDFSEPYYARTRGATLLVLDPNFTVGVKDFKTANQKFLDEIHKTSTLPDSKKITIPGDRATETKETNLKNGYLDIDEDLWNEIKAL